MLLERYHGVPGKPGLKEDYSQVEESLRMRVDCPCLTRTCPNHGFCSMCIQHHRDSDEIALASGREAEGTMCDRLKKRKEVKES